MPHQHPPRNMGVIPEPGRRERSEWGGQQKPLDTPEFDEEAATDAPGRGSSQEYMPRFTTSAMTSSVGTTPAIVGLPNRIAVKWKAPW